MWYLNGLITDESAVKKIINLFNQTKLIQYKGENMLYFSPFGVNIKSKQKKVALGLLMFLILKCSMRLP